LAALFSEELGVALQIREAELPAVLETLARFGLADCCRQVARPRDDDRVCILAGGTAVFDEPRSGLRDWWSATSHGIQRLRDDAACADEEHAARCDPQDPGLTAIVPFAPPAPAVHAASRPRMMILREQGVNGQVEMAAAFHRAGFEAVDVHMSDLLEGRVTFDAFRGVVACGGFSYGDVLGAGEGWAKSILFNPRARDAFQGFFERPDSFALGVCNGCQMLSALKELIPGAAAWPRFVRNRSEQFEARLSLVEVLPSPSLLLEGMEGARLPIAVAHGEGRAECEVAPDVPALRFVDGRGRVAEQYPANPNGSPQGIAGLTTEDGRFTIMMPHPERVFRTSQLSWVPPDWAALGWGEDSPWMQLFRNARRWSER
jgi:phosphoribosylformylglycinamidine synthase